MTQPRFSDRNSPVVLCDWKATDAGYEAWVRSDPEICANGRDFELVKEELSTLVMEQWNPPDTFVLFEPPPPDRQTPLGQELVGLAGCSRYMAEGDEGLYFEGGRCKCCGYAVGARTDQRLRVRGPVRVDSEAVMIVIGSTTVHAYNQKALAQLETAGAHGIAVSAAPVDWIDAHELFFECRSARVAPSVALRSAPGTGWHCPECHRIAVGYWSPNIPNHLFIASNNVKENTWIETARPDQRGMIAVNPSVWSKYLDLTERVVAFAPERIGAVSDELIDTAPNLPLPPR
jgi:hypothetical protein